MTSKLQFSAIAGPTLASNGENPPQRVFADGKTG